MASQAESTARRKSSYHFKEPFCLPPSLPLEREEREEARKLFDVDVDGLRMRLSETDLSQTHHRSKVGHSAARGLRRNMNG